MALKKMGGGVFKKTFRNPFDVIPDTAKAQMRLSIASFYVNEAAFDRGNQLKRAAISAVIPVSQTKKDKNFITLTGEL